MVLPVEHVRGGKCVQLKTAVAAPAADIVGSIQIYAPVLPLAGFHIRDEKLRRKDRVHGFRILMFGFKDETAARDE
jgi:hypothetical protein